jgi:esterase/lipase superfamily enzyme
MAATRVHFATNRQEIAAADGTVTGFGPGLNPRTPLWLRYGAADMEPVRGGRNHFRIARLDVAKENIPTSPEASGEPVLRGSDAVFAALRERLVASEGDLVMLLHGYACDFAQALSNAAELKTAYGTKAVPIETAVFSWPADGRIVPWISYASDRDDARSSAKAIARALQRFLDHLAALLPDPPRAEIARLGYHPGPGNRESEACRTLCSMTTRRPRCARSMTRSTPRGTFRT